MANFKRISKGATFYFISLATKLVQQFENYGHLKTKKENVSYYLANKNLPAHLHVYLSLESSNHKKIGEIIKALQICKRTTQNASL